MLLVKFKPYGRGGTKWTGKYKSLEQLFFQDPGFVDWVLRNNIHKNQFSTEGIARAEDLKRRASLLKIPGTCHYCGDGNPRTKMVLVLDHKRQIDQVTFNCEKCPYGGSSRSLSLNPSFFVARHLPRRDHLGGRILVAAIKRAYFGSESYPITSKRADEFFNNPENFVNF